MSVADEMYEGIESVIEDLLQHYKTLTTCTDCEEYRREGAISALERLLEVLNE